MCSKSRKTAKPLKQIKQIKIADYDYDSNFKINKYAFIARNFFYTYMKEFNVNNVLIDTGHFRFIADAASQANLLFSTPHEAYNFSIGMLYDIRDEEQFLTSFNEFVASYKKFLSKYHFFFNFKENPFLYVELNDIHFFYDTDIPEFDYYIKYDQKEQEKINRCIRIATKTKQRYETSPQNYVLDLSLDLSFSEYTRLHSVPYTDNIKNDFITGSFDIMQTSKFLAIFMFAFNQRMKNLCQELYNENKISYPDFQQNLVNVSSTDAFHIKYLLYDKMKQKDIEVILEYVPNLLNNGFKHKSCPHYTLFNYYDYYCYIKINKCNAVCRKIYFPEIDYTFENLYYSSWKDVPETKYSHIFSWNRGHYDPLPSCYYRQSQDRKSYIADIKRKNDKAKIDEWYKNKP